MNSRAPTDGKLTVLILDDDARFGARLARAFEDRGWRAWTAAQPTDAIALAEDQLLDLAVIDLRLGASSGIDAVRALRTLDAETVILLLTGYGSIATAVSALRAGASDYLTKPADADQLVAAFERQRAGVEDMAAPSTIPSLDQVEWEHIQRVLADCQGNISRAAKLLGVHRRSLQRKLAKRPMPNP
jgi:two-component system response regulator RegA